MEALAVAIVGCGLIGRKRAQVVRASGHRIVGLADSNIEWARDLFREFGDGNVLIGNDETVLMMTHPKPDIVICAGTHDVIPRHAKIAISRGCHVLMEKPGGRTVFELMEIRETPSHVHVRVGYNLRYHPAIIKASDLLNSGGIGNLLYFNGYYGNGARLGFEREWRCNGSLSGGGVAIDLASHLIDLCQWFTSLPLLYRWGFTKKHFWNIPVEDNATIIADNVDSQVAEIRVSWTEWKNTFRFEIVGTEGGLVINGLGGSYGTERLTHYRMRPTMGPPDTTTWEFPRPDESFKLEFEDFASDVLFNRRPSCGIEDAINVLKVIEDLYNDNG